nr:hemK methyltransferase family member 2 [Onthophagus taurus]
MSLPTPSYDLSEFKNVYEPREDTFLLLDALEKDLENIKKNNPMFIAEIGSGSGIIITALSCLLKTVCFATDLNPEACYATLNTSKLNKCEIEVCNMNFLSGFKHNLFDLIIFNPPYVVTASEEISGSSLSRSWAGGLNGREIIDKLLMSLPNYLSNEGICYLLVLKENNPEEIIEIVKKVGFKATILLERKIPSEHLFVLKLNKL